MYVVLDTNVLISALWSPGRTASEIVAAVASGNFTPWYDDRILEEYNRVMHYPKFVFEEWEINSILVPLIKSGISIVALSLPEVPFSDPADRKFYEVARACGAVLVTGNWKHYPDDEIVMKTADFYAKYLHSK